MNVCLTIASGRGRISPACGCLPVLHLQLTLITCAPSRLSISQRDNACQDCLLCPQIFWIFCCILKTPATLAAQPVRSGSCGQTVSRTSSAGELPAGRQKLPLHVGAGDVERHTEQCNRGCGSGCACSHSTIALRHRGCCHALSCVACAQDDRCSMTRSTTTTRTADRSRLAKTPTQGAGIESCFTAPDRRFNPHQNMWRLHPNR